MTVNQLIVKIDRATYEKWEVLGLLEAILKHSEIPAKFKRTIIKELTEAFE